MIEENKTLKDLKRIQAGFNHDDSSFGSSWINEFQLKQEAIKHIKKIQKENEGIDFSEEGNWGYTREYPAGQIKWIKMFFNIIEEDLK